MMKPKESIRWNWDLEIDIRLKGLKDKNIYSNTIKLYEHNHSDNLAESN
jgi:hypothetical protein